MPAPAQRFFEPTFRESIANYVTVQCRLYRIRRVDIEDVVQDALTKILARIDMFRAEKGDFDTWSRRVALNVIRRYLRNAKRYGARFSEYYPNVHDYATSDPSPERCARRKQAQCALTNAAENLSSRQVDVLILHVIDDMTHGEVGRKGI